jgi:hypothetical protein
MIYLIALKRQNVIASSVFKLKASPPTGMWLVTE